MAAVTELIAEGTELFNKGDLDGYCAHYNDDVVLTTPDGRFEGRDSVKAYMQGLLTAFPDTQVTIGRHCDTGDVYFGEFTVRATNTGPISMPDGSELPPTQKSVHVIGNEIATVKDGKIAQHDMLWDNMSFFGQLGLVPAG
jgi:ketosteroid isomerase-like protein